MGLQVAQKRAIFDDEKSTFLIMVTLFISVQKVVLYTKGEKANLFSRTDRND